MRKVSVYGLDDRYTCVLSRDVGIIVAVMEVGVAEDAITFTVVFTGEELLKFMAKHKLNNEQDDNDELIVNKIVPANKYKLTAYDW